MKNPPKQLNCIGNLELLKKPGIAMVGSRICSKYGEKIALKFSKELSLYDITIISGMAIGIDYFSHKGALDEGGKTIAVLPSGLKNIYPNENIQLFEQILDSGGLVISEYDDYYEANSKSFLERNRIISGLSIGVLIVEGAYRSGTSVTAKITLEDNKKLFCIPSSLENNKGYMPNHFIRKGGILVTSVEDIIEEYSEYKFKKINNKKTNIIDKTVKIDKKYEKVYNIIGNNPININEIVQITNINIEDLNYQLMMLELDGYIETLPGKYFKRRNICI